MNERFSADAQRVLALAQEEARFLGHPTCGSEHLLLGLIRDAGPAGAALARRGMPLDAARKAVAEQLGRGDTIRSTELLPWDAAAKTAISGGLAHAAQSQSALVETSHLLFGVLGTKSDRLVAVLARLPTTTPPPPSGTAQNNGQVPMSLEQRVDDLTKRVDRLAALVGDLAASDHLKN